MSLNPNNVVIEVSNTVGTGTLTLQGPQNANSIAFHSAFANNQTIGYFIQDIGGNSGQPTGILEVGIGQFITNSTANSLIRSFVLNNSYGVGNTSFVNFPGNSLVFYNQSAYSSYYANSSDIGGSPGGANTNIQTNDSGSFYGDSNFTYNKTTQTVVVANTILFGNSTVNSQLNSTALSLQGTPVLTLDGQYIQLKSGNGSVYILIGNTDAEGYMFGNWIVQGTLDPYTDATYQLGTTGERWINFYTVTGSFGNSTANVVANSSLFSIANSTANTLISPNTLDINATNPVIQFNGQLVLQQVGSSYTLLRDQTNQVLYLQSNGQVTICNTSVNWLQVTPTIITTPLPISVGNSTVNTQITSTSIVVDGVTLGAGLGSGGAAGGFLNKFRNGTMDVWQHGLSGFSNTTAGPNQIGPDGWYVVPAGANCEWAINTAYELTSNSLAIIGATSITDILIRQRIEGCVAAPLTNQTVTVQAIIFNDNAGTTFTPTLTVKHANTVDNWTAANTDLAAVSLQSCANNTWTQVAYTFTATQYCAQGLEITLDFGNHFGNALNAILIAELDIRATPGVATGLNNSPPVPEMRPVDTELHFCQRYYQTSYGPGVVPGTATYLGIVGGPQNDGTTTGAASISFETTMRTTPSSVSYWDGAGNASKVSYISSSGTTFTDNSTIPNNPFNISRRGFIINGSNAVPHVNVFLHYAAVAEL